MRYALLATALLVGCGPSSLQIHARAADTMGRVTNAATGELETAYEAEQLAAVEDACGTTEPAEATEPCQVEARAGAREVRETWDPVWSAHDQLRTAHDAYRETLQIAAAGDLTDPLRWARLAARLVRAYEALVSAAATIGEVRLPPPPGLLTDAAAMLVGDRQ